MTCKEILVYINRSRIDLFTDGEIFTKQRYLTFGRGKFTEE